jgi:hypothetical protein
MTCRSWRFFHDSTKVPSSGLKEIQILDLDGHERVRCVAPGAPAQEVDTTPS